MAQCELIETGGGRKQWDVKLTCDNQGCEYHYPQQPTVTSSRTNLYASVTPCIDSGGHRFRPNFPPAGQFGYALIVCERCGAIKQ